MKKRILIFALLLTGISYSFAGTNDGIAKRAIASFKKDFSAATDIKWQQKNDFVVATFSMNNQVMFAYYSNDGELLGLARNILSDKLPISQSLGLKNNYSAYWISELFEVNKNGETVYYATVENGDVKLVLKSDDNRGWQVYSREEKE